ncbi:MAG: hypothetical protein EPO23_01340 [Xanthobacteraceae bacterium]|nr:MAG: hypothetical protein EPO23_01340 [Xanthobacteraceae bacterium]
MNTTRPDNSVTISDIQIPFWHLVAFFVKASIAAIPAAIIVAILYAAIAILVFGLTGLGPIGMHR